VSRLSAVKALDELTRCLKPNGLLIISSPNRIISNILYKIFGSNPYHLHEFTPNELKRELESRNLKVIRKAAQYFYLPFIYALGNKRLIPLMYFIPNEKIPPEFGRYFLLTAKKFAF
jgi:SAM-dependent methyltransferase